MPIKKENYELIRKHFYLLFNFKCAICGLPCDESGKYTDENEKIHSMELDHIIPNGVHRHDVSRSKREWEWFEAYDKGNLQLLCSKCNKEKGDNRDKSNIIPEADFIVRKSIRSERYIPDIQIQKNNYSKDIRGDIKESFEVQNDRYKSK